ncbi:hypothetical protein [Photobacterium sanguinicancri]|uniref:Uncharacterized protein n=1 Tax=Photobacterium sanguinicancri TaxID=875932 RepID=A0AAW7Y6Z6_9GAMM|nr:hypothetical protein [Photobacterium sanguinicancri]MDO6542410.1 hypothetical protein [Photobacterium sanguinicancri]
MEPIYICDRCHQSDEYLISESGTYTCICGYQFVVIQHDQTSQDTTETMTIKHAVH